MNKIRKKFKSFIIICLLLLLYSGCKTLPTVKFDTNNTKQINKVAIIGPEQSKELKVNLTGDANLMYLFMGPAIIPQIALAYGTYVTNKEEGIAFNGLIFDFNIEKLLRKRFRDEIAANTYFAPILQSDIKDDPKLQEILNKYPKTGNDYTKIASRLGVDTIIDLSVYSYYLKDPGLIWDPNVALTVDAKMIRVKDSEIIWQIRMKEDSKRKSTGLEYFLYKANNAELLRFELEAATEIVAKALVQNMGFKVTGEIADIRSLVTKKVTESIENHQKSPEFLFNNVNRRKHSITLFP